MLQKELDKDEMNSYEEKISISAIIDESDNEIPDNCDVKKGDDQKFQKVIRRITRTS